jgi:CHAT domain-containing protein
MLHRQMALRAPPTKLVSVIADPVFSPRDERLTETSANSALASLPRTAPFTGGDTERPHATLPRLFRTRWEAQQIASLTPSGSAVMYLDFDANRETFMSAEVGQSRILHIATHAIINDIHPELSGVALSAVDSDGRLRDGLLRVHDIYNLRLSADLVVLSSCRSALGKDFQGEGLVGLARGFMYAGAMRVIGSLWSTDDKATAELMVRFYRQLLRENLRPPAALRAAQISMLSDKRWRQPYYWAGFTLQGEWQ